MASKNKVTFTGQCIAADLWRYGNAGTRKTSVDVRVDDRYVGTLAHIVYTSEHQEMRERRGYYSMKTDYPNGWYMARRNKRALSEDAMDALNVTLSGLHDPDYATAHKAMKAAVIAFFADFAPIDR